VLVFELPAEELGVKALTLMWLYGVGREEHPRLTRFVAAGPELARRSISGDVAGMTSGASSRSESGVPFLMDLPFLGFLFRGSSSASIRSSYRVGSGGPDPDVIPGEWWPLE
jgi:hypothetical protein